jgi:ribose/xylose/arabinose/galactoside ABC-type transport system permease subunit
MDNQENNLKDAKADIGSQGRPGGQEPNQNEPFLRRLSQTFPGLLQVLGLVAAWAVIYGFFAWQAPDSFLGSKTLETILRQTIIVGFAAVGMTYIIARGAIDLSVGSVVALVTVVIAKAIENGMDPLLAAILGVVAGGLAGLLNGGLTVMLKVGSFIVTLASLLAIRGVAKGIADNTTVNSPENWLADLTAPLPDAIQWLLLPKGGWLLVVAAVLASWALGSTVFGRRVIAVGSNENTAKLCGVNPDWVTIKVFVLGGIFAGLAGLIMFSRLTIGDPTVAGGLELKVIAAVVIGGASLNGGAGSVMGSLFGALIMTTIASGSSHMGLENWHQEIVTGAIIVAAVALDRWRLTRAAQKGVHV